MDACFSPSQFNGHGPSSQEGEDLRSKLKSGDRDLRKMLEGPGRVKFFEDDEDYIPLDKESDEEMSLRKRNKIESEDKVV